MQDAAAIQGIESRYVALASLMDERMRRQWAAAEAKSYGWGGMRAVSRATGMSPNTIAIGRAELEMRESNPEAPRERGCENRAAAANVSRRSIRSWPRVGKIGRSDDARRSSIAVALDVQEHDTTG